MKQPRGLWGTVWERPSRRSRAPSATPRSIAARIRFSSIWVHHGTERRGVVQAVSQLEFTRRADEGIDDGVLSHSIADRHQHAPGKTALSRRAEARSNQVGQDALQVGIGQDEQMVLRSAVCLNTLAVSRRGAVDRLRHGRRADEGNRLDMRVGDEPFADFLAPLHHADDARRQAGIGEHLHESGAGERCLLGRLEEERVPAGDGDRHHPQRNQGREIERRNADHHTHRFADGDGSRHPAKCRSESVPSSGRECRRQIRRRQARAAASRAPRSTACRFRGRCCVPRPRSSFPAAPGT